MRAGAAGRRGAAGCKGAPLGQRCSRGRVTSARCRAGLGRRGLAIEAVAVGLPSPPLLALRNPSLLAPPGSYSLARPRGKPRASPYFPTCLLMFPHGCVPRDWVGRCARGHAGRAAWRRGQEARCRRQRAPGPLFQKAAAVAPFHVDDQVWPSLGLLPSREGDSLQGAGLIRVLQLAAGCSCTLMRTARSGQSLKLPCSVRGGATARVPLVPGVSRTRARLYSHIGEKAWARAES